MTDKSLATPRVLHALIVVFGLAAAGVMGEFAVRLAEPDLDPTRHLNFEKGEGERPILGPRNTEQRQFKNTGDFNVTVRFNRHGLRDSKDLAKGTADDFFLVGDSFTFGWGVEEKDRISERLQELIGRRVFNLSMPTGFIGYDKLLRYAAAKGADVNNVIIAVSMDNDIGVYENQTPAMDTVTAKEPTSSLFRRIKGFLTNQSALYLLTTTLIRRSPVLNDMAARAGLFVPNLEAVRKNEFSEQAIDSSARFLAKIAARYRTTVAVLPSRALWLGSRQAIEAKRHARFISRLKELGIVAVDLRTAFEDRGDPLAYHFDNDPHWKPSGHLRAAQALAARLKTSIGSR